MTSSHKPWWDTWAFAWPEERHGTITATGTPVQAMLIPCFPPLNGRAKLLRYYFSNGTATAGVVTFVDQYISDPTGFTPTSTTLTGTNAAPKWQVNLPVSGDVSADCNTEKSFQAGVVLQSTVQPVFWSIQLAITALG